MRTVVGRSVGVCGRGVRCWDTIIQIEELKNIIIESAVDRELYGTEANGLFIHFLNCFSTLTCFPELRMMHHGSGGSLN